MRDGIYQMGQLSSLPILSRWLGSSIFAPMIPDTRESERVKEGEEEEEEAQSFNAKSKI